MTRTLLSASKVARRVFSVSSERRIQRIGNFVHSRCLTGGFRVGTPKIGDIVSIDTEANQLCGSLRGSGQIRSFLGCGDGEEGDALSKTYSEKLLIG